MLISDILEDIIQKLNDAEIDFYVVGAIGAYLDAGIPFARAHDDLDILINEDDVSKLPAAFEQSDYIFYDNRHTSTKILNTKGYTDGEHEVYAVHKTEDFHIGFFLFRHDGDTYTIIEYFRDGDGQKKLERTLPSRFFELQYNITPIVFRGLPVKTVRKEMIFKNKLVMGRSKDEFDRAKLKPKINPEILEQLSGLHHYRKVRISEV